MKSLLDTLAELSSDLRRTANREVILRQINLIGADAEQIKNEGDRERVARHLQKALRALASLP